VAGRPETSEYVPYFERYVTLVQGEDIVDILSRQLERSIATMRSVSEEKSLKRYDADKWSMREVLGHLIDTERIFAYRALRFARHDQSQLCGFEPSDYVAKAAYDERSWVGLLSEFEHMRRSHVLMFSGFDAAAWRRSGTAGGEEMSVRALAFNIAGHELHHIELLRTKYQPGFGW